MISVHAFGHLDCNSLSRADQLCSMGQSRGPWDSPVAKILSSAGIVNCNKTRPFFCAFPGAVLDLRVGRTVNCFATFNSIACLAVVFTFHL